MTNTIRINAVGNSGMGVRCISATLVRSPATGTLHLKMNTETR